MGLQWTPAWPQEPRASPFLGADYNRPGKTKLPPGFCIDGVIDPSTGDLRPGVAAAAR
jgi:hypothetical protein